MIDTYNLADFGLFYFQFQGAFSWVDGGKRERVIFNPAVSKLATCKQNTRGHNWEKREEPKYDEKKKCGTSRGRNKARGGGRHSGQVLGSMRLVQPSFPFLKS